MSLERKLKFKKLALCWIFKRSGIWIYVLFRCVGILARVEDEKMRRREDRFV